jgi:hypothetical protein
MFWNSTIPKDRGFCDLTFKMFATKLFEYSNAMIFYRFTNIDVNRSTTYYKVPFAIDAYGVERSFEPFYSQPKLYLNVTYDMYEVDPKIPPRERAEIMLADDMIHNSKLKVTWEIAMSTNPAYNSVS